MIDVPIHSDYITLQQLLKKLDIVSSGGEVKDFLAESPVVVNGTPEQRRGRKLVPGDVVAIDGDKFRLVAE